MVAPKLRMLATTLAGIGFGLAVGFGIAFAHAETRVVDGMPRRVVRFEANRPDTKEFLFEFPADFVPHRPQGR